MTFFLLQHLNQGCLVDDGFGQIKKLYMRNINTKGDIARVIYLSSKSNRVPVSQNKTREMRYLKSYLSLQLRTLKVCFILKKIGIYFKSVTLL